MFVCESDLSCSLRKVWAVFSHWFRNRLKATYNLRGDEFGRLVVGTLNELHPHGQSSGRLLWVEFVLFSLHFGKSFPSLCLVNSAAPAGQTLLFLERREPNSGLRVTIDCAELRVEPTPLPLQIHFMPIIQPIVTTRTKIFALVQPRNHFY